MTATMLDASGCLMMGIEVDSGLIVAVNRTTERLTGFTSSELSGRPIWEVIRSAAGGLDLRESLSGPFGTEIPQAFESLLECRTRAMRRVVWSGASVCDASGTQTHTFLTGIDVTVEWTSAGLLSHLVRAATSTALVGADLDGRITFFSSGAESLLGYSATELLGQPISSATVESSEFLTMSADDAERYVTRDWRMVRKDGSHLIASVTVSPVTDDAGTRIGYLGVAEDVTEQRRSERVLLETLVKEQAAVDRLAALERARDLFVTTVSHELRTPLTSIAGYAELLQDGAGGRLAPQHAELVGAICRNTERLTALVDNLLDLSSIEACSCAASTPRRAIDLRDIVTDATQDLAGQLAKRHAAIELDLPDTPVYTPGARSHLRLVISHLLTNALQCTTEDDHVRCHVRVQQGHAITTISDTGFGIPLEEQPSLFTKFFRTSTSLQRAVQGAGLGLALVQRTLQHLGGTIEVASTPMIGTTVTVALPLTAEHVCVDQT